ncbi:MAG: transposase [Nitrososphaerota archaeon]|nr:transposase [Nitrososphaerota archaeon]
MLRTNTVLLKPTPEQEIVLSGLLEHSARLWNAANYECRQALFKHLEMPSYSRQCAQFKTNEHFVALGTGKGQALLQKLRDAWMAYRGLKKLERENRLPLNVKKVHPPGYWKEDGEPVLKLFAVRCDCWSMNEKTIGVGRTLKIPYSAGVLWVGKRGRLEVRYDRVSKRWYAHVPVKLDTPEVIEKPRKAAIDLGVCNLVTLAIEGVPREWIWSGRQVLADWQYWTKRIAGYEAGLKTVNGKDGSKELSRLYRVRALRKNHAINAMLRHLFEVIEDNGVGLLKFGDLTGIRNETNYGDSTNQKLHNFWPFAQVRRRICELAEEYGITVEPIDENGSSKTCVMYPNEQNGRIHRGLYRCSVLGVSYNADAGGAVNLLYGNGKVAAGGTQQANLESLSGSGLMAQPLLLRWDYQKWSQAPETRSQRL